MTKDTKKTTAVKKTAAKKTAAKAAVKKTPAKAPAQKAAATKVVVKKAVTKKTAAKKAVATKAVKKTAAKKAARKVVTTVIAEIDAGFGNGVYLRGSGGVLSWDKGTLMDNVSPTEWVLRMEDVPSVIEFKVLLNDENWSAGPNVEVAPGGTVVVSPRFE